MLLLYIIVLDYQGFYLAFKALLICAIIGDDILL